MDVRRYEVKKNKNKKCRRCVLVLARHRQQIPSCLSVTSSSSSSTSSFSSSSSSCGQGPQRFNMSDLRHPSHCLSLRCPEASTTLAVTVSGLHGLMGIVVPSPPSVLLYVDVTNMLFAPLEDVSLETSLEPLHPSFMFPFIISFIRSNFRAHSGAGCFQAYGRIDSDLFPIFGVQVIIMDGCFFISRFKG